MTDEYVQPELPLRDTEAENDSDTGTDKTAAPEWVEGESEKNADPYRGAGRPAADDAA